jgi:hypothetical protein
VHFLFLLGAMASIKRNANAKTRKKNWSEKNIPILKNIN